MAEPRAPLPLPPAGASSGCGGSSLPALLAPLGLSAVALDLALLPAEVRSTRELMRTSRGSRATDLRLLQQS